MDQVSLTGMPTGTLLALRIDPRTLWPCGKHSQLLHYPNLALHDWTTKQWMFHEALHFDHAGIIVMELMYTYTYSYHHSIRADQSSSPSAQDSEERAGRRGVGPPLCWPWSAQRLLHLKNTHTAEHSNTQLVNQHRLFGYYCTMCDYV